MIISLNENFSNFQHCCNKQNLYKVYRHIPFISPALEINYRGNYEPSIDLNLHRGAIFFYPALTALSGLGFLTKFALSYIVNPGASFAFTALATIITPVALLVSIVGLGILGFKLDEMLTYRAANKLAIADYLNKEKPSIGTFTWLLKDSELIKQLLENENINLSKKDDSFDKTLLEFAVDRTEFELISLLWNKSSDDEKARVFIDVYAEGCLSQNNKYRPSLDFFIDKKMISPKIFNQDQLANLYSAMMQELYSTEQMSLLSKFIDLGFDIDSKGNEGTSIRDVISEAIFSYALDSKQSVIYPPRVTRIRKLIELLQGCIKKQILGLLANGFRDENSILSRLPKEILALEMMNKLEDSFEIDRNNVLNENNLQTIAPYLSGSKKMLIKVSNYHNVEIGLLLWDKANDDEKKEAFIHSFVVHENPKLAITLMKNKKVSANMFTEEEQYEIFYTNLLQFRSEFTTPECIHKLIEIGFNISAKNSEGENIRDALIFEISLSRRRKKELIYLKKVLELVNEASIKQIISLAMLLECGRNSENSNLNMFPKDVIKYFVQSQTKALTT